ncbi:hypothetical protein V8C42DRAFT_318810 [Trichoderma barbatum]
MPLAGRSSLVLCMVDRIVAYGFFKVYVRRCPIAAICACQIIKWTWHHLMLCACNQPAHAIYIQSTLPVDASCLHLL